MMTLHFTRSVLYPWKKAQSATVEIEKDLQITASKKHHKNMNNDESLLTAQ